MSVRVVLALTVVALLLAGCGGGSSDTSSSTVGPNAGQPGGGDGASAPPDGSGAGAGDSQGQGGKSPAGSQPSQREKQSPAGKQATRVPLPTGAPEPGITPQQRQEATVANMVLESPSSQPSNAGPPALDARFTCDGQNTSPALRWKGVPEGTAELVLFAMNTQPVEGRLFFDWAVAGLGPELEEIEAGKLPKGAVVGRNGFGRTGYGICPEGSGEVYVFALFALPERLSPSPGFDPLALRKAVLDVSRNVGLLALSYVRR